jgi:subtilisin family serine protease
MSARLFFFLLLCGCLADFAQGGEAKQWIVRLPSDKSLPENLSDARIVRRFRHIPWIVLETNDQNEKILREAQSAGILTIEPNQDVQLAALPNDPLLSYQVFVQPANPAADIHLPQAWDFQTSTSGVVVATLDSGVDPYHPDLLLNLWHNAMEENGSPGIDDDGNGHIDDILGWNVIEDNNQVTDTLSHGTRVTGVMAARGNNAEGIAGVSWRASVMSVRCFDANPTPIENVLAGFDYIFDVPQIRVINTSWGITAYSQALQDAVTVARDKGITVVAAAGNLGEDIDTTPTTYYPASFDMDNVVAVGGIQTDGLLWDELGTGGGASNYGLRVAVVAPGSPIHSTEPGNIYTDSSGTSFAAPYVCGAIALLLSREPGLTPAEIKYRLISTSRHTPELAEKPLGGGLLDVSRLLQPAAAAQAWWWY